MRVLTLWQPWASLVACGAKTIETRSWCAQYRGELAIHAAARRPPMMHLPPLARGRGPEARAHDQQTWFVCDTITDPAYQGLQPQGRRIPKRAQTPTLWYPHAGPHGRTWDSTLGTNAIEQGSAIHLPLGAIVATCTLTDVLPIYGERDHDHAVSWVRDLEDARKPEDVGLWIFGRNWTPTYIENQRPYGDFRPGRYAWLLTDIRPLAEPVPFKGGQGLTRTWEPA